MPPLNHGLEQSASPTFSQHLKVAYEVVLCQDVQMVPFKKKKKTIFIPFLSCKHVQVVVI
jgi:hypothetical protein